MNYKLSLTTTCTVLLSLVGITSCSTTNASSITAEPVLTPQTVVMVHGLGASSRQLQGFTDELASEGCPTLLFDLPGFADGRSAETYTIDVMENDLSRRIDELSNDTPVVILGNSMGGLLAMRYAIAHQDKVAGLILVAPAFWSEEGLPVSGQQLVTLADPQTPSDMRSYLDRVWSDASAVDIDLALREHRSVNVNGAIQDLAPSLATGEAGIPESVLQNLSVPVLIIQGTDDGIVPPALSQSLNGILPYSEFVLIEDAGHWPQMEQPDAFWQATSRLYDSTSCSIEAEAL